MDMPKWLKWTFGITALAAATAACIWLAGFLFFAFSKTNPVGKTDFFTWWIYWQHYHDDTAVAKRLTISAIIAALATYTLPAAAIIGAMRDRRALHGEARFATSAEIRKAGLLGSTGIIVGKWKKKFLMFGGLQFVLLAAPTRSGKGVGIVIPNLLNFSDSVVVLDVKQENFLITSKFREKHGQEVYLFNPFAADGKTHRYNPLDYISDNPRLRVTEILAIGYALYPGQSKDAFFDDAARNLFLGLTLYLCETPELPRTIGELLRLSSGKGQPVRTYLQDLINTRNYRRVEWMNEDGELVSRLEPLTRWDGAGLPPLSMECVDALNRFTSTSDNTLSSILASFNTPLTLWVSPIVDAATSANDFDLRAVRTKRMSIYLGVPANKLTEAELLINLFFSQLVNLNTEELLHARPELKYQCMLLMDEFAAPGRIGIIDKSNAYMAGYGLRLLTIIQSPSQLEAEPRKGYGREGAGTLITNHACQILYTPRKQSDANEYSEMLGYYTFKSKGISRQRGGKGAGGRSESESDQKRALMLPQELKEMRQREQIISLENTKPIRCEKIAYFADHAFIDRLKSVSPRLAALDRTPLRNILRRLGIDTKVKPPRTLLEATWGSGELAAHVPCIDLDLHDALVHRRSRTLTTSDVEQGIDLRTLALNLTDVPVPAHSGMAADRIDAFVDGFFEALDAAAADDIDQRVPAPRAGERHCQVAAQKVAAAEPTDDDDNALNCIECDDDPDAAWSVSGSPACTEEETEAPAEDLGSSKDGVTGLPLRGSPRHAGADTRYLEAGTPLVDLSVLEKPITHKKDA